MIKSGTVWRQNNAVGNQWIIYAIIDDYVYYTQIMFQQMNFHYVKRLKIRTFKKQFSAFFPRETTPHVDYGYNERMRNRIENGLILHMDNHDFLTKLDDNGVQI